MDKNPIVFNYNTKNGPSIFIKCYSEQQRKEQRNKILSLKKYKQSEIIYCPIYINQIGEQVYALSYLERK